MPPCYKLFLYIKVRWVGDITPTSGAHPASHQQHFEESYEDFVEHTCYGHSEAERFKRGIVLKYGQSNRSVEIREVSERQYEGLLGARNEVLNELEELFL